MNSKMVTRLCFERGKTRSEGECGWCEDRWGFSRQIVPRALLAALADADRAAAKRAMEAMMTMRRIDIPAVEAARAGQPAA